MNITWTDTADADPIGDLRAWQERIRLDFGIQRNVFIISEATRGQLIDFMRSAAALEVELRTTLPRARVRLYRIKRKMGRGRFEILLPRLRLRAIGVQWRWVAFKHRNDPDWN